MLTLLTLHCFCFFPSILLSVRSLKIVSLFHAVSSRPNPCHFLFFLRYFKLRQFRALYLSVSVFPVFASRFCLDLASAIAAGIAFIVYLYVVVLYAKYRALFY